MTRRRVLLLALPIVLMLLGVGVWLVFSADARTIRPGMTRAEVEEILGPAELSVLDTGGAGTRLFWIDPPATVDFDNDDIVVSVEQWTELDRLRRWLHL
jgi:hypothetical protein